MNIDLTQVVLDIEGNSLFGWKQCLLADKDTKLPIKDGENFIAYNYEDKSETLSLGRFIRQCLLSDWEGITDADKLDKFDLLRKLEGVETFEFTARHHELIKKSTSKQSTWIFGLIHELLKIK